MNEQSKNYGPLPKTSNNEDLETDSRKCLALKFDSTRFEIRDVDRRDKGVDTIIELKDEGAFTSINFIVQVKASELGKKNKDGSYSLTLESSNINYLLRDGREAYYMLYIKEQDTFYYEELGHFVREVFKKNNGWKEQETHTVRFHKKMTKDAVDEIFQSNLVRGNNRAKYREMDIVQSPLLKEGAHIHLDGNRNPLSDIDLIKDVERNGHHYLNTADWKKLLKIDSIASPGADKSAKYHAYVGIAMRYSGRHLEALSHFSKCKLAQEEIDSHLLGIIDHMDLESQLSMKFISRDSFDEKIEELSRTHEGSPISRIENARRLYLTLNEPEPLRFERFKSVMVEVIDSCNDYSTYLQGHTILSYIRGIRLSTKFTHLFEQTAFFEQMEGKLVQFDNQIFVELEEHLESWIEQSNSIDQFAIDRDMDYSIHYNAMMKADVLYNITFTVEILVKMAFSGRGGEEYELGVSLSDQLKTLRRALNYFESIVSIDNQCKCLSLLFSIEHYLGQKEESRRTHATLTNLVRAHDFRDGQVRLDFINEQVTFHSGFEKLQREIQPMRKERLSRAKRSMIII